MENGEWGMDGDGGWREVEVNGEWRVVNCEWRDARTIRDDRMTESQNQEYSVVDPPPQKSVGR